jgi:hypothetical protein
MDAILDLLYLVLYILFVEAGVMGVIASLTGWRWFFNNERAQPFVERFGMEGARIVYFFFGIILIVSGASLLLGWW